MTEFFNFCREYGVYILGGLCFVFQVVCLLVKRCPKTIDDFKLAVSDCLKYVASFVCDVEKPGCGEFKKKAVENYALRFIERRLGRSLTFSEVSLILPEVDNQIECVLKAPTKKEIL